MPPIVLFFSFSLSKKEKVLTSKSKEAKERNLIDGFFRVVDLGKETEMWIGSHGIVTIGDPGRERTRDIPGFDNIARPPDLQSQQQERQEDTTREQVLVDIKR